MIRMEGPAPKLKKGQQESHYLNSQTAIISPSTYTPLSLILPLLPPYMLLPKPFPYLRMVVTGFIPPPLHLEPLLSRITSDPDPSYYWTSGACPWPSPPLINFWPPPQILLPPQNFRHQLLSYPNLNPPHHFMLTPPPLQIFCIPWGRISMHFFQHHHWRPPF